MPVSFFNLYAPPLTTGDEKSLLHTQLQLHREVKHLVGDVFQLHLFPVVRNVDMTQRTRWREPEVGIEPTT
jgi:hypothetical protein